jgi:hypothetical protein
MGGDGDFLYMRVDFNGQLPSESVPILASGEIEAQTVKNQGMNIAMNVDGDAGSGGGGEGVDGIDIFFAIGLDYGRWSSAYANWDFDEGDLHVNAGHMEGEIGQGGSGYDYAVVRYDISDLGSFFPRGQTVELGGWSEAESFDADGNLLYHHFAFDPFVGTTWLIPL